MAMRLPSPPCLRVRAQNDSHRGDQEARAAVTPADLRKRAKEATPGPWRNEGRFVRALKIKVVAEVPEGGIYHGKVDAANTRLIALAPDLADALADTWGALRDLVEDYEEVDPFPTSDGHPLYAARAVLAKLEGLGA